MTLKELFDATSFENLKFLNLEQLIELSKQANILLSSTTDPQNIEVVENCDARITVELWRHEHAWSDKSQVWIKR
jgi:hypothetical protein